MSEPANREKEGRNPDGTFIKGVSGNPSGRPRNTLKDFTRQMFMEMTDEEKKAWLKDHKIAGIDIWKMAEGNPKESSEVAHSGTIATTTIPPEALAIIEEDLKKKKTDEL